MMKLELATLKDNPTRDKKVDPIDEERIRDLRASMRDHKFWGGVVVAKVNGHHYILAGHSRVRAAIREGNTHADLTVLDEPSDETMLRVYSMENATQRGNDSSSVAGSVAGAIRLISKALLTGNVVPFGTTCTPKALEVMTGQLQSAKGIGKDIITKFLHGIPGINVKVVSQQLANLKASGHYARIIAEVEREIAAEAKAAEAEAEQKKTDAAKAKADTKRKAATRAKKASTSAEAAPVTFDMVGVQKHLKTPEHVDIFRKLVTSKGVAEALKREHQGELAAAIVAEAKEQGRELTGNFIHEVVVGLLSQARYGLTAETRAKLRDESEEYHFARHQEYFADHIRAAVKDLEVVALKARKVKDPQWSSAFVKAVEIVRKMSDDLFTARSTKPQIREIGHAAHKN